MRCDIFNRRERWPSAVSQRWRANSSLVRKDSRISSPKARASAESDVRVGMCSHLSVVVAVILKEMQPLQYMLDMKITYAKNASPLDNAIKNVLYKRNNKGFCISCSRSSYLHQKSKEGWDVLDLCWCRFTLCSFKLTCSEDQMLLYLPLNTNRPFEMNASWRSWEGWKGDGGISKENGHFYCDLLWKYWNKCVLVRFE